MTDAVPRLRMFAGPNGSGKTTVKNNLGKPSAWFGIYINPDDLEAAIQRTGFLPLSQFDLATTTEEVRSHFGQSQLLNSHGRNAGSLKITVSDNGIDFSGIGFDSYFASVLSDFLRRKALQAGKSFTFETVMSAPDKVQLLQEARTRGYRTYLYYIATEDPAINIQRVRNRVAEGGHDVPEEKIIARHARSLSLLSAAIRHTNRAYFFDTSGEAPWYFAEATDGLRMELKSDEMPHWFQGVWEEFGSIL